MLHSAAAGGNAAVVGPLLSAGACPLAQDQHKSTPLALASRWGRAQGGKRGASLSLQLLNLAMNMCHKERVYSSRELETRDDLSSKTMSGNSELRTVDSPGRAQGQGTRVM